MSESKLTAESLAVHGLCAFIAYKGLEKICDAMSGFAVDGNGYTGALLTNVSGWIGTNGFVTICCALCAVPLIIKLAGTIRRKYTKHHNEFGGSNWYDEYIRGLEHPDRKDAVQQDRVSQHK
ncbi:hypothetical protein [Alicyclobacillus dauci]|uniref:Uncharacterized protein n=1 Tax=Alicyclobacillus dauci TaxID=1475485 RepID=A0ABY6Z667_9BACL|nr:hypothetical protein [Alicyclobacillus dauci]WAH38259.1 hypothetical protein NZD86_07190 [Alicyclobacillus dauci]